MNTKRKIFCLPYAGGSCSMYYSWSKYLNNDIEIVPIELAGRGERINEPLYSGWEEAIEDILRMIRPNLKAGNYSIFGHSMGAFLAYELVRKITSEDLRSPDHLFLSGNGAPNVKPEEEKHYHLMDDEKFQEELFNLGGTPIEIVQNDELMQLFLPLLKSDFRIASTDLSNREVLPFKCDITVLIGKEEPISAERLAAWKGHTLGLCSIYFLNGGHFFINNASEQVIRIINAKLTYKINS